MPSNWADIPFPLIPTPCPGKSADNEHGSTHIAQEMTHLHNVILRVLNSIYQQAPHIKDVRDIKDFLQFVKAWHDQLLHHHDVEEAVFFPDIEKLTGQPGLMEGNVAQHDTFEEGLKEIGLYATETIPEEYSSEKLLSIIDSFGHVLQEHLNDEIETLKQLKDYDSNALKQIWKKSGDYAKSSGESVSHVSSIRSSRADLLQAISLPIMIGGFDVEYEGRAKSELLPPFFVLWLNDLVFSRKYAGAWRFLPCNSRGKRRPLPFMPSVLKA
jgi:hemerythrin-like domain-containing protein